MNKKQALTGQALKNLHVFGKMARRHYANTVLTWGVLRLQPPSWMNETLKGGFEKSLQKLKGVVLYPAKRKCRYERFLYPPQ